jgi:hypothetical protein
MLPKAHRSDGSTRSVELGPAGPKADYEALKKQESRFPLWGTALLFYVSSGTVSSCTGAPLRRTEPR